MRSEIVIARQTAKHADRLARDATDLHNTLDPNTKDIERLAQASVHLASAVCALCDLLGGAEQEEDAPYDTERARGLVRSARLRIENRLPVAGLDEYQSSAIRDDLAVMEGIAFTLATVIEEAR